MGGGARKWPFEVNGGFGEMRTWPCRDGNGVQLEPGTFRWLMGLPHAWDESSPGVRQEWRSLRRPPEGLRQRHKRTGSRKPFALYMGVA